MKAILLLAVVLFSFASLRAQEPAADWRAVADARSACREGRHEAAAALYLNAASRFEDTIEAARVRQNAGECWIHAAPAGHKAEALRRAIYFGRWNVGRRKTGWASQLAGSYLAEQQYDSALHILRYVQRLPQYRPGCGMGMFYYYAAYQHQIMQAWEGLGQLDSAIAAFLPVAFETQETPELPGYTGCHAHSGDYHCLVVDFVRLLRRRYSDEQLRRAASALIVESEMKAVPDNGITGYRYTGIFVYRFLGYNTKTGATGYYRDEADLRQGADSQRTLLLAGPLYELLVQEGYLL